MNKKGQLAGWEALIIFVLLAMCAGLGYLYANKKTEANVYQYGSKPNVMDMKPAPFSCIRVEAAERWNDVVANKVSH